jgi:hypothetical protein
VSSELVASVLWGMREQRQRWKPGHEGVGWCVPREGIVCAMIKAVCTDMRGPTENPDLLSCDGGLIRFSGSR